MKQGRTLAGSVPQQGGLSMATRREFLGSEAITAAPEACPIPQEVAGIKLPDGKLARDARRSKHLSTSTARPSLRQGWTGPGRARQ